MISRSGTWVRVLLPRRRVRAFCFAFSLPFLYHCNREIPLLVTCYEGIITQIRVIQQRDIHWIEHTLVTGSPVTLWVEASQDRHYLLSHIEGQKELIERLADALRNSTYGAWGAELQQELLADYREWKEKHDAEPGSL